MNHRRHYPYVFILGAFIPYVVLFIIPAITGIAYSFTDWNSYSTDVNFIGLDNFRTIFSANENYLGYILNTLIFTSITIVLKTILGLFLALLLNEGVKRLSHIYRLMIYLPVVLPTLVVALVFRSILNPATGLLNVTLRSIGLGFLTGDWLVNPSIALFSVISVDTWKGVGYIMVILLAGLQTIPKVYYEAPDVAGANYLPKRVHLTLPLLAPAIVIVTVLNVLYGLRVFDIVFALTNGGPGYATEVMSTAIFNAFSHGNYGLGTAFSSILFLILVIAGYFVIRLLDREQINE